MSATTSPTTPSAAGLKPLEGIRVVELASYISAPFATMTMADLGAEVTKVEPMRGDPYRRFGLVHGDSSFVFKATNQNKRNVQLDLKDPDGFEQLLSLLDDTDVLISNWRPSVAPGLGLTEELVRSRFPRLIWVRVSGYGQTGPLANMPAYDKIVFARSGAGLPHGDEPRMPGQNVADKVTAMTAAQTATAMLLQRSRTGEGTICDIAMLDAITYFNSADVTGGHRVIGMEPEPQVAKSMGNSSLLPTSDGYLTISPVSGQQIRNALAAVGHADDWEALKASGPSGIADGLFAILGPILLGNTAEHWESIFTGHDVPASALRTFDQHLEDPQVIHNELYSTVTEPGVGEYRQVRYPALVDGAAIPRHGLPTPGLTGTE